MKYIKNKALEYLDIDDENLAIYDPDSGDTHYINETGKTILALLDEEIDEAELIDKLCADYFGPKEEISGDLCEFLDGLAEKKVIVCL